jgi:hypothetical protein
MTSQAQKNASAKYEAANIIRYVVKLNRKTDADLIAYLDGRKAQTEFKNALRTMLERRTK